MDNFFKSASSFNRRSALGASLGLPLTMVGARLATAAASPPAPVPQHCVLTPQAVEGPFYFDPHLERSDVTEGLPGVSLVLRMTVLEAGPCTPLIGARVDVWSAASLIVGVDRHGVIMSGGPDGASLGSPPPGAVERGPPPGPPLGLRRSNEPAIIVPGVPLVDQHPT